MKLFLKEEFKKQLLETGTVTVPGGRTLEIYKPAFNENDVEVRFNTLEGQQERAGYERLKNKFCLAICSEGVGPAGNYLSQAHSPVLYFDSREEAADKLVTEGVEVGFMPLQAVMCRFAGEKSSIKLSR